MPRVAIAIRAIRPVATAIVGLMLEVSMARADSRAEPETESVAEPDGPAAALLAGAVIVIVIIGTAVAIRRHGSPIVRRISPVVTGAASMLAVFAAGADGGWYSTLWYVPIAAGAGAALITPTRQSYAGLVAGVLAAVVAWWIWYLFGPVWLTGSDALSPASGGVWGLGLLIDLVGLPILITLGWVTGAALGRRAA